MATIVKTHNEIWLAQSGKRIAGYCKSRGWRAGQPHPLSNRQLISCQHGIWISDTYGSETMFIFMPIGLDLVNAYGRLYGTLSAKSFEREMIAQGLRIRPKASKRQLSLEFTA